MVLKQEVTAGTGSDPGAGRRGHDRCQRQELFAAGRGLTCGHPICPLCQRAVWGQSAGVLCTGSQPQPAGRHRLHGRAHWVGLAHHAEGHSASIHSLQQSSYSSSHAFDETVDHVHGSRPCMELLTLALSCGLLCYVYERSRACRSSMMHPRRLIQLRCSSLLKAKRGKTVSLVNL